jgi:hypothetical protein
MSAEIVWGVDFKAKTIPESQQELTELANKIFAEALDVGGPDLWLGAKCPNGIDDLDYDGKEPA